MRIFSYIFIALSTIFVINIALSFSLPAYRNTLVEIRTSLFPASNKSTDNSATVEKSSETSRLVESLDRIDKHIESLTTRKRTITETDPTYTASGISTQEGSSIEKDTIIPISGIFLAKIMPEIMMKKIENAGFFDIQVMGKIPYSTYYDDKKKIKIYAFRDTYDTLLLNMKLTSSVYTINETDQFFGYTFFLNPTKKDPKDATIRFVTALEGRAIGVEVPKNYYQTFKKLLLKNK